ncbi:MAG: glycosyltransferase [Sphingobacteriaceae bacterium]|nr:MAG: glycosyltransferase [Sphingobacteriaceae bacterium]
MNKKVLGKYDVSVSKYLPQVSEGTYIPKIIHQTFMSKNLPLELQKNVENLKKLNPDWVYQLYDDNDIRTFIIKNYGLSVLDYYEKINSNYGAAKADMFRYLVMYKCGGVYLDIKSTCIYPLNDILKADDKYILSQWRNKSGEPHPGYGMSKEVADVEGGEYQQWHIIAVAGHPFLKAVIESVISNIEKYRPWINGTGGIGVLRLTGPLVYTLAIQPLLSKAQYRLIGNETALGLQYSVYTTTHHRSVYKTNYSLLTESIIQMDGFKSVIANLYSLIKKSKHIVFGR